MKKRKKEMGKEKEKQNLKCPDRGCSAEADRSLVWCAREPSFCPYYPAKTRVAKGF